ncbi:hypothetical protein ACFQER_02750 [Halomicroarcula sp. GCM10025894]|uniref:hypothetical protein n=1 Tax=Halomicroarcula sp. GCM10025894 TaxID=3252673 RepID=UPI0036151D4C
MPEITVTESQRERLEAIQEEIEAAYIDTYGHIRTTDVVQYLLDTYTPPSSRATSPTNESPQPSSGHSRRSRLTSKGSPAAASTPRPCGASCSRRWGSGSSRRDSPRSRATTRRAQPRAR